MSVLPNSTVPFVGDDGHASPVYQELFGFPRTPLVDRQGRATRELAQFFRERNVTLPNLTVPLLDREARPEPVFYAALRAL